MITTEDKIIGVENLTKDFENLGDPELIEQGNTRLKELKEQLKQEQAIQT